MNAAQPLSRDIDKPPVLEQRPEATTFKVEDLLAEVKRGRIRIPPFQRPFKWKRDDALKLLDSIYLGYPIGTLLFWQTKAEAGQTQFGSVLMSGPERPDAYWVVDGQQRLVSLVRTLMATSPSADEFSLFFDLESRRVVPQPKQAEHSPSRFLPFTEVLDSERLMKWVFEHVREDQESVQLAFELGKRIREYPIPAYIVRSDSDGALREIFGRVNRLGKQMTADEVFEALNGLRSEAQPSSIEQIVSKLRQLRFGVVEKKVIYRLMRVLQDKDIAVSNTDLPARLETQVAQALYERTVRAAERAVEFLMRDVGIPHYELLPYKQPLVTLGKFFDLHPSPSPRSRQLLARWVWRGALNGSHRGDTVSTRGVLSQIDADENASVQRLLNDSRKEPATLPDAQSAFNFRHAQSKLELLALLSLEPRHIASGARVAVADLVDPASDHFLELPRLFPTRAHRRTGLHFSVANRLAHPPTKGLRDAIIGGALLHGFNSEDASADAFYSSHGLNASAAASIALPNGDDYLSERQQQLSAHFQSFFDRRAQWNENDRPPLNALLAAVDEEAPA